MNSCSGFNEGPVEEVSVVSDKDVWLHVQDVVEELLQQADLVLLNKAATDHFFATYTQYKSGLQFSK